MAVMTTTDELAFLSRSASPVIRQREEIQVGTPAHQEAAYPCQDCMETETGKQEWFTGRSFAVT